MQRACTQHFRPEFLVSMAAPETPEAWLVTLQFKMAMGTPPYSPPDKGYKVSMRKAQILQTRVTYLGFILKEGQRCLLKERKAVICSHLQSFAAFPLLRQLRGVFLGVAGFCLI